MQARINSKWAARSYPSGLGLISIHYMTHESWVMHIIKSKTSAKLINMHASKIFGPKREISGSKEKTLASILKS